MGLAPGGGEVAAEGGGEDRLAVAVEEVGELVELLLGGTTVGLDGVEAVDDSALLGKRWKRDFRFKNETLRYPSLTDRPTQRLLGLVEVGTLPHETMQVLRQDTAL